MHFFKRLLSAAICISLAAQLSFAVFAESPAVSHEEKSTPQISDSDFITVPLDGDEQTEYTYENNDPSYVKYLDGKSKVGVYNASNLVHNSRFNGYDRTYGIDVSYFQTWKGDIDWNTVKASGIDFVIVRLGYRGYGNGALMIDDDFYKNINGAIAAGLDVGVYFFTQAITLAEAQAEAEFCLKALTGYNLQLPVFFDQEKIEWDSARFDRANLSYSAKTALCEKFCSTIEANGYEAGIYSSSWWMAWQINGPDLSTRYELWIAHFANSCSYNGDYGIWQYTGNGWVSGIPTAVDINVRYHTDPTPNGVPALTQKMSADGKKAVLNWTSVSGTDGYTVFKKSNSGSDTVVKVLSNKYTYTVTPTSATETYYVRAYKISGGLYYYGKPSNSVTINSNRVHNLKASEFTPTKINLVWDKVEGCTGYRVYRYNYAKNKYEIYATVRENSCLVSGLSLATEYTFKVIAYFNSDNTTKYVSGKSVLGPASLVLKQPTKTGKTYNLKNTSSGASSIVLKWDNIKYKHDGYQIVVFDKVKNKYVTVDYVGDVTSYTVKNLDACTAYTFKVRAYYNYGSTKIYGAYCDPITAGTKPSKVTGLNVSSYTYDGTAKLSWTSVKNAGGYDVYVKTGNTERLFKSVSSDSCIVTGLKEGSTYSFRVRAYYKSDGKKYVGSCCAYNTIKFEFAKPEKLSVTTGYTATSTNIKWTAVTGATGYEIYKYDYDKKTYEFFTDANASTTSYTFANLPANSKVRVKVCAKFGNKKSGLSNYVVAYTKPDTPKNFKCSAYTSTAASLSWSKVKNADFYRLYIYDTAAKKYVKYLDVKGTSTTLKGLSKNKSYKFKVCAVNLTDWKNYLSAKTSAVSFTTKK